jgi:hypothetical protein
LQKEAALIGRLHQKIGKDSVFSLFPAESYLPEKKGSPSFLATQCVEKNHLPLRPLVLLKRAEPLKKIGGYLVRRNKKYRVKSWLGPERLLSEWWIDTFARQYWVVELDEDICWWVYSDLSKAPSENLFLHGIYD